ncbi:MAG: neutral zinc metallopeptidase [Chloroflexia bacterium]
MLLRSGKDRARLMAFLLIGVALVMACGNVATIETDQAPSPTQDSGQAPATCVPATRVADPEGQDTDGDRVLGAADKCPAEPETYDKVFDTDGCPDNGIQELMEVAAQYINDFWVAEFKEAGARYEPPAEIVPYTREIDTLCGPAVLNNAFYCPNSHGIYYDLNFLQDQLDSDGDFAPVTILAHEWGHLVQGNLDLLNSGLYSVQLELQADCFAGAWANYAGELEILEEGDLDEGATALFKAGDDSNTAWFDPQAHGQPDQRIQSFDIGLKSNTDACFEE